MNFNLITTTKVAHVIEEDDIQFEAQEYLGRKINCEEMQFARKLLSYGIGETIDSIYNAIFCEIKQKAENDEI